MPPVFICFSLLIVGISLLFSRIHLLGLVLVGLGWSALFASLTINDRLPIAFDGKTILIEGTVTGLPESTSSVTRFQITNNYHESIKLPHIIRLSWYGAEPLVSGERWIFKVKVKYPKGTVNPLSFDYEAWLTAKKIGAIGSVKQGRKIASTSYFSRWRHNLRDALMLNTPANEGAGLSALVLGDGSGITKQQWQVLQYTFDGHFWTAY